MSTKIYYGYRVSKKLDIKDILLKCTEICKYKIAGDADMLYLIHAYSVFLALKEKEKCEKYGEQVSWVINDILEENEKGKVSGFIDSWIRKKMKEASIEDQIGNPLDVYFTCAVGWDRKYWYLKFFPNGYGNRFMEAIEEKCDVLEDFHYQNSTDPPEGMTWKEFDKRNKKWSEITAPDDSYRNMLSYTVFDAETFRSVISKYYWTGEKDLYKHLAYKFDKKVQTSKDKEKTEDATTESAQDIKENETGDE